VELLLKKLSRQTSVAEIDIPVFIPALGSIARDVVTKNIYPADIEGIALC